MATRADQAHPNRLLWKQPVGVRETVCRYLTLYEPESRTVPVSVTNAHS